MAPPSDPAGAADGMGVGAETSAIALRKRLASVQHSSADETRVPGRGGDLSRWAFDVAPTPMAVVDRRGHVVVANEQFAILVGWPYRVSPDFDGLGLLEVDERTSDAILGGRHDEPPATFVA